MNAQQPVITLLDTGHKVSIRGLSVVNDNIVWASGSSGSVAKSIDGGKTFTWMTVAGYEKRDFRDIEAFDANTAIIMGIAEPAVILKTKDGGNSWYKVFEDTTKGMFLDAMDFNKKGKGMVVGDPINKNAFLAATENGGDSWEVVKNNYKYAIPSMSEGEAFFASSGTNIKFKDDRGDISVFFTSGGKKSRLFIINECYDTLPIIQGKESTGANSIDVWKNKAVIVGGDFANDKDTTANCVLVNLKKGSFTHPQTPPHGYRSCVIYVNKKTLVTCGTSGVDVSYDGGINWQLISPLSFHVVQKAKDGKAIFLAGGRGKIAKLTLK